MPSLKKILVGLDGSKNSFRALRTAIQLAKQTNSSITVITVIQTFPTEMGIRKTIAGKSQSKHYKQFTRRAKNICIKENVKFFHVLELGEGGKKITAFAQKNKFDIIVIGSRGMGKMKEIFLGSTSNYIVHKSKTPVLIVK